MRSVVLTLALAGCIPVPGDRKNPDPDEAAAAAAEALDALREASSIPVTVSARYGIPAAVSMAVPLGEGAPVDAAYAFLGTYAALYGLDDPHAQLWPRSADEVDGTHIRFVQRSHPDQGGLPLFDSGLTVHVLDGVVYLTTGRYVPHLVAEPPVLGWEEALANVELDPALTGLELQGEARLGLYAVWPEDPGPAVVHTVWRMTVTGRVADTGAPAQWRIDVDARSGALVHRSDLVATCDKDFDIMYGSHTDASETCWAGWADTEDWFDEDGALDDYSPTQDHNDDGREAWDHAHTVFDWYADTFGHCSYDDDDAEVEMVTHADIDNASASGFCGTMQFRDDFTTLDIVTHEFTHLVDYNHNDLEYENQSGALDESFADVMACMLDRNWTMGEGLPNGPIRDLSNPIPYGDPDHWDGYVSGGDVHVNSGIPNKAAWLITAGGSHRGYTTSGLGWSRAQHLYHAVHIGGLEDDASFRDARDALVGTAMYWGIIGYRGFDGNDWCQVANAWAAVGIGVSDADTDCDGNPDSNEGDDDGDGVSDGSDVCPHIPDPAQADTDGDGRGDPCDDDTDGDGIRDDRDNCPWVSNANQADANGDGIGDLCADADSDGILDDLDNCPGNHNWGQADADQDGQGDICDPDADGDGVYNDADNCPTSPNPDQAERDGDGFGDACDTCPDAWNPDQDHCACAVDILEKANCAGLFDPEENLRVHPLDEVELPWIGEREGAPVDDDYRLELVVVGTGDPWVIVDHAGNLVARSELFSPNAGIQHAQWTPRTDYRYAEDGERAPFGTDYRLQLSPFLGTEGVDVRLQLEPISPEGG